jgi:hypothetical protein
MLDPNLSLPIAALRPSPTGMGLTTTVAQTSAAKAMPDMRQTLEGVMPAFALDHGRRATANRGDVTIFHPAQGPSTEITENILMARALLSPIYIHDSAATRMARVSTMANRSSVRYGGAVDILA